MLELKRNPGGSIDKRCRATLRPMSKTRRDSSVSELETKLKDVKAINSKFRKTLLERETELQMLIRRLGNDARDILDSRTDSLSDTNRLSVPLLRKEAPSATETSDITSLCSLSSHSQDLASLHHTDSQSRKKKISTCESPKPEHTVPPAQKTEADKLIQNGNLAKENAVDTSKQSVDSNYNSVKHFVQQDGVDGVQNKETVATAAAIKPTEKTPTHERRTSKSFEVADNLKEKSRQSPKSEISEREEFVCHRRVSVPSNRTTPKKKPECGTHIVAKSELWDTGSQHRCPKSHVKSNRVSISQDEDESTTHHRSVSERNRHSAQKRDKPSVKKEMPTNIYNQQCNKLGYFQSTPNVAALKSHGAVQPKRDKSMYNATSESELLDREILPIFQKLLTERNKSQHNIDYSFGRSCPNISIKCDIVEYL